MSTYGHPVRRKSLTRDEIIHESALARNTRGSIRKGSRVFLKRACLYIARSRKESMYYTYQRTLNIEYCTILLSWLICRLKYFNLHVSLSFLTYHPSKLRDGWNFIQPVSNHPNGGTLSKYILTYNKAREKYSQSIIILIRQTASLENVQILRCHYI